MPRISTVEAGPDLHITVTWSRGAREGLTDHINLAPIVKAMKYFRALRNDRKLFESVHSIAFGAAIAWGDDDEIDLSADAILRLVQETMTGADLRAFIDRQELTETALAAMLDYSRRQIVGFINEGRPIPRVVSLACKYYDLVNPVEQSKQSEHPPIPAPHHGASAITSPLDRSHFLVSTNVLETGTSADGAIQNVA